MLLALRRQRVANKSDGPALPAAVRFLIATLTDPALLISTIDLVTAWVGFRMRLAHQQAEIAAVIFTRMLLFRLHSTQRHRDTDVTQIQTTIPLMHHVVIVGKAQA